MITKLITQFKSYDLTNAINDSVVCAGYKSAKVVIRISGSKSGSTQVFFKDSKGESLELASHKFGKLTDFTYDYRNGDFFNVFNVDLSVCDTLKITASSTLAATSAVLDVFYSYASFDDIEEQNVFGTGGGSKVIETLSSKYMTFHFSLNEMSKPSSLSQVIRIKRSDNGTDWVDAKIIYKGEAVDYFYMTELDTYDCYVPTMGYKYIKVSTDWTALKSTITVDYERLDKLCRDVIVDGYMMDLSVFGTSKYIKFNFNGYNTTNFTSFFSLSVTDGNDNAILPVMYDLSGNKMVLSQRGDIYWTGTDGISKAFRFMNFGEKLYGGFILGYEEEPKKMSLIKTMYEGSECVFDGVKGNVDLKLSITLSDEPFDRHYESAVITRRDYDIFLEDVEGKVVDALGEDILVKVNDTLYRYYRFGLNGVWYDLNIDNTHIPSLMDKENVRFAKLVFNGDNTYNCNYTRVCLFTNKNRILYNRIKGKGTDINYFREAPLYNTVKQFYPVNEKSKAVNGGKYLPIFPDYDYNQFDGRIDGMDSFGLAKPSRGMVGSLLEDFRKSDLQNGLGKLCYSNFVNSDTHGCFYGNYNLQDGSPFIAVTDNGKAWYIVKEFGVVEDFNREGLTTQRVDLSTIINNAGGYVAGSLKLTWRKYNVPTEENKEPSTPFVIKGSAVVSNLYVQNNETFVTFEDDSLFYSDQYDRYRCQEYAPCVYFENINASSEYNYICNSCKSDGSDNTGVFFRLQLVSGHTYKLWGDVGNPFEGEMICRHIHSVSESSSGFLVATGENYWNISEDEDENADIFEGGFLYYIPADGRNDAIPIAYSTSSAKSKFGTSYRVCSSKNGVNRACGAYLKTDFENTIIYVSDDCARSISRSDISGRAKQLSSRPFGVFSGKLNDVDDASKFGCIAEIKTAALGLVYHKQHFATCNFAGDVAISADFGKTWHKESLAKMKAGEPFDSYSDVTGILNDGSIYYGNMKIKFKE